MLCICCESQRNALIGKYHVVVFLSCNHVFWYKEPMLLILKKCVIIIGLSGKVEITRGIHAVFHNMPLMWTTGYLSKGLVVMEQVCNDAGDLKLCKEIVSMWYSLNCTHLWNKVHSYGFY